MKINITFTAIPFISVPIDAAVGRVLGTVTVLVSQIWIKEVGIFNSRLATYCGENGKFIFDQLPNTQVTRFLYFEIIKSCFIFAKVFKIIKYYLH